MSSSVTTPWLLLVLAPVLATGLPAAEYRCGDADAPLLPGELSTYYPQASEWASVGVTGGLPREPLMPTTSLDAGADLQAAIDAAEPGVIALAPGRFLLPRPLQLRDGVVLRGAGPTTVLVAEGASATQAVRGEGLAGAGLEHLRITWSDPAGLAEGDHLVPTIWANAPGWQATGTALVELVDCRDCHLDGVVIDTVPADALLLQDSERCTLRSLQVGPAINRGSGSGRLRLVDSSRILVCDSAISGLRYVELAGATSWSAIIGCTLGSGIYFRDGDRGRGLLFESCDFILPPGYPFRPFNKGPMPLGPDSLVINCRAYHAGTDAVVGGVLMEEGVAYVLQPRIHRGRFDPHSLQYRSAKLVERHQMRVPTPEARLGETEVTTIPASGDSPPPGALVFALRNNLLLADFLSTGAVDPGIAETPLAELLAAPLQPGDQTIGGIACSVAPLPAAVKKKPGKPDPHHVQQMQAKFGIRPEPPSGASIDILKALDGDWQAGAVFQGVTQVHAPVTIVPHWKRVGCVAAISIGAVELVEDSPYRLEPGYHIVTVRLRTVRKPPFIKDAHLGIEIQLQLDRASDTMLIDTPKPEHGSLYPRRIDLPGLPTERAATDAWFTYFHDQLRNPDGSGLRTAATGLITAHPGTVAAHAAAAVLHLLDQAPHDETTGAELSQRHWGELKDYYEQVGLPVRKWVLGKAGRGEKIRTYYHDQELD